jgi:hypothetical protein
VIDFSQRNNKEIPIWFIRGLNRLSLPALYRACFARRPIDMYGIHGIHDKRLTLQESLSTR